MKTGTAPALASSPAEAGLGGPDAQLGSTARMRLFLIPWLLFGSGLCALIYQTVWLREFRLVFGGSTAANAAVLAIFMAGLGAGSIVLGFRADKKLRPLRFYAQLELLIAAAAAASPFLLWLTRSAYISTGGAEIIGVFPAVIVRLILSAVVVGLPTFLMGGTLPAAGRAVEKSGDGKRRRVALIYGANTLGAVLGVMISTFYLLEHFGNRGTLWFACAINLLVALIALRLSRSLPSSNEQDSSEDAHVAGGSSPIFVILAAAWLSGFIFFLMELVWYRMMTPLLGGTTFSFGLILAVALLGVGLGSTVYATWSGRARPTLNAFALTCAAEAFFLALPYALGDRIAVLAVLLRPLGAIGLHGHVLAWSAVTAIVVLPAAIVAGIQFPLLIALLGEGRENVGRHTGLVYAFNTLGAISGSLAGGFGLLPALSATGAWKFCVLTLAIFGVLVWIVQQRLRRRLSSLAIPAGLTVAAILMILARGPTAAWRQSPIGAGRANEQSITSVNAKEEWLREKRRYLLFQEDGTESCLGVDTVSGISFLINGKSDGHAIGDAPTQVMVGLLGAILQPNATRALVIGLGTGSTAGWLGEIPAMERVEVVELEPAVLKVAELCAPVNRNVLSNAKVQITIGDAREKLLTLREQYDLIISEPSNPYRAGVAGLYTADYYKAASRRLRPGGLFLQFVQAYEVDGTTIRSIYATFSSAFPNVQTWQTSLTDLVFIGANDPIHYDAETLRKRIAERPFAEALTKVWRATDVEGVLARFVANESFAREMSALHGGSLNTDDRNLVEFSFARTLGTTPNFDISLLRAAAHQRGADRPSAMTGQVDWENVDDQNTEIPTPDGRAQPSAYAFLSADQNRRVKAQIAYLAEDGARAMEEWRAQPREPQNLTEWAMMADLLSQSGDESATKYIENIKRFNPTEASLLLALLRSNQGRLEEAAGAFETAYASCRTDPWAMPVVLRHSFPIASLVAAGDKTNALTLRLYHALEKPFAAYQEEKTRRKTLVYMGSLLDRSGYSDYTRKAIASFEPDVPWEYDFLMVRRDCYRALSDPLARRAARDFSAFVADEPPSLESQP